MTRTELIALERSSIAAFVRGHKEFLTGHVLDFGCGKPETCIEPMPYRKIIEAQIATFCAGSYTPHDLDVNPGALRGSTYDAVLMTQVLQYVSDPRETLAMLRERTRWLVMTYPTLWYEAEAADRWRFTKAGVDALLREAGYRIETHKERWRLPMDGFDFVGGYGVVAESTR